MSCEADDPDAYVDLSGVADQDGVHVEDYEVTGTSSDAGLVRMFLRDGLRGALGRAKATQIMDWIMGREHKVQARRDFGPYTVTYNGPMSNGQVRVVAD